jgi:hypothetical protein
MEVLLIGVGTEVCFIRNTTSGSGYTKIYSNRKAFATLKPNGSIKAWGHPYFGGINAPAGRGYTKIYSTANAFAALKANDQSL